MKIIILNLSRNIDESELNKLFAKYGEIKSCNIIMDKETNKSKGFGFIEMANKTEAEIAINELHNSKIKGNKIRVKLSDK